MKRLQKKSAILVIIFLSMSGISCIHAVRIPFIRGSLNNTELFQKNYGDNPQTLILATIPEDQWKNVTLKKWNFSSDLISAVINHERPNLSPVASRTSLILYLANMLTRRIGFSPYQEEPEIIKDVMIFLDIDEPAVDAILEEVSSAVEKTIASE